MKILLSSDLNPGQINGVIVSVLNLKKELEKKGHEVRLLCLSADHRSHIESSIYYVGSLPLNIYPDIRASLHIQSDLLDELVAWHPDIIHSQCEFFTYSFVQRIAGKCHCPIVHTYHTLYRYYVRYVLPGRMMERLIVPVMRYRLRTADAVIAPTRKTKNLLVAHGIAEHTVVIATGIDLGKYDASLSKEKAEAMRQALAIPPEGRIYGSVGRLGEEKNLDEILRAHQALLKRHPDAYLVLVGDGAYRQKLEEAVDALSIRNRTRFTGMVPPDQVGLYYRLFEFFVSASVSETQGLTYIEALANGRPVLARRDDAPEEVVEEGENGFLFDTTDQLVEQMDRLLSDAALLSALSDQAWASRDRFGMQTFGNRVEALYQKVLNTPGRPQLQQEQVITKLRQKVNLVSDRSDYGRFYAIIRAKWARTNYQLQLKRKSKS